MNRYTFNRIHNGDRNVERRCKVECVSYEQKYQCHYKVKCCDEEKIMCRVCLRSGHVIDTNIYTALMYVWLKSLHWKTR